MDIRQTGTWYPLEELLPYHELVLIDEGDNDFQLVKWDWTEDRYKYRNPESSYSYRALDAVVPGEWTNYTCCTLIERIHTK